MMFALKMVSVVLGASTVPLTTMLLTTIPVSSVTLLFLTAIFVIRRVLGTRFVSIASLLTSLPMPLHASPAQV